MGRVPGATLVGERITGFPTRRRAATPADLGIAHLRYEGLVLAARRSAASSNRLELGTIAAITRHVHWIRPILYASVITFAACSSSSPGSGPDGGAKEWRVRTRRRGRHDGRRGRHDGRRWRRRRLARTRGPSR